MSKGHLAHSPERGRLLVVGAGISGLAACAVARERGLNPILINSGTGASALTSGAVGYNESRASSEKGESIASALDGKWARNFLETLGLYRGGASWVATYEGIVRPAQMVGELVLSLDEHKGKTIGVIDIGRGDFCAERLASAYRQEEWSRRSRTQFTPLKLSSVWSPVEASYPLAHFCRLLDEKERFYRFQRELLSIKDQFPELGAFLLGPWLGVETKKPSEQVSLPFGEVLSPPEGPFGRRFLRARAHWLDKQNVQMHDEHVIALAFEEGGVRVESRTPEGEPVYRWVEGLVVATGGLLGGGVGLKGSFRGAPADLCLELAHGVEVEGASLRGEISGWDAQEAGGAWIRSPHWRQNRAAPLATNLIQIAGDASPRDAGGGGGTIMHAVISARRAALRTPPLLGCPAPS